MSSNYKSSKSNASRILALDIMHETFDVLIKEQAGVQEYRLADAVFHSENRSEGELIICIPVKCIINGESRMANLFVIYQKDDRSIVDHFLNLDSLELGIKKARHLPIKVMPEVSGYYWFYCEKLRVTRICEVFVLNGKGIMKYTDGSTQSSFGGMSFLIGPISMPLINSDGDFEI